MLPERDVDTDRRAVGPESPRRTPTSDNMRVRIAATSKDVDAVLRLRFEVFNVEIGEGLASSWDTGRDEDEFDTQCHHLVVEDVGEGRVVGTYRMQTVAMARAGRGFYSEGEFDLSGVPGDVINRSIEVGRACIAREHRNRRVLFLLWKGLAGYLAASGSRYLFGCCSITSQDPVVGMRALEDLRRAGQMHPTVVVPPRRGMECRTTAESLPRVHERVDLPILFRTYLRYGAKVCGPPAIDREFRTIDFFTLLDVDAIEPDVRRLYF